MSRRLLLVPTGHEVGLTSVSLGVVRALERLGVHVGFLKPIRPSRKSRWPVDRSTALIRLTTALDPPDPVPQAELERLLGEGDEGTLLDLVTERFERVAATGADVIVIEGMVPSAETVYSTRVNVAIAKALDCELVVVGTTAAGDPKEVANAFDIELRAYGDLGGSVRSCILNKVRVSPRACGEADDALDASGGAGAAATAAALDLGLSCARARQDPLVAPYVLALEAEGFHLLGAVPRREELAAPRIRDLALALGARALHEGAWTERRFHRVSLCAATVRYACQSFLPGTLIITPGDREDILCAAALAELGGTRLGGLLLTGGRLPEARVLELCRPAIEGGLPILSTERASYDTAATVHDLGREVPPDDKARAELVMGTVADSLDTAWLRELAGNSRARRMTAAAFRYQVVERARRANMRIVLPEGDEPRTVAAAAICGARGIARCVLLADPESVRRVAEKQGVKLPDTVEVIDPRDVIERYVAPLVELRKHKGLTAAAAQNQLEDTVVLGTMMLKLGEVDGLVSGAVHTTANTIRPAFQLIKTAPGHGLVSSVFFMCLPEQVLVYGDCAVVPNPSADELAEIAIQSAASARAFGIEPRVAMISYSTGASGEGADVDKVREATRMAKERAPTLCLDGPLQYDAAAIAEVGRQKAPGSPVAGRATVFIFPDLNTGNTTYKAVQRSAQCISVGPMLQGLAKPVNDLSRGALIEDIVFTIALTAIQATQVA